MTSSTAGRLRQAAGRRRERHLLSAVPGGELARGGAGDDRLYGGLQDDSPRGGDGDDLVIGSQGSDELAGDEGEDWLRGDTQRDSYDGGGGADTLSFAAATPPEGEGDDENGVTVRLQPATPTETTPASGCAGSRT